MLKRNLKYAALAVTLGISGLAWAGGNNANVNQNGAGNNGAITQNSVGFANASIDQTGNNNTGSINQHNCWAVSMTKCKK